jgi:hypothetical protein
MDIPPSKRVKLIDNDDLRAFPSSIKISIDSSKPIPFLVANAAPPPTFTLIDLPTEVLSHILAILHDDGVQYLGELSLSAMVELPSVCKRFRAASSMAVRFIQGLRFPDHRKIPPTTMFVLLSIPLIDLIDARN